MLMDPFFVQKTKKYIFKEINLMKGLVSGVFSTSKDPLTLSNEYHIYKVHN